MAALCSNKAQVDTACFPDGKEQSKRSSEESEISKSLRNQPPPPFRFFKCSLWQLAKTGQPLSAGDGSRVSGTEGGQS